MLYVGGNRNGCDVSYRSRPMNRGLGETEREPASGGHSFYAVPRSRDRPLCTDHSLGLYLDPTGNESELNSPWLCCSGSQERILEDEGWCYTDSIQLNQCLQIPSSIHICAHHCHLCCIQSDAAHQRSIYRDCVGNNVIAPYFLLLCRSLAVFS